MSFPFATLDLLLKYIRHDVPIYCHDHPTQPDGMNACVKDIETRLKAFELPDTAAEMSNPVDLGTLKLRDHAGVLEVSDDAGVTWQSVGILDHTGLQNIGTNTHAQLDAALANLDTSQIHLDGDIIKISDGWLRYDAYSSTWFVSNTGGAFWDRLGGYWILGEIRMTCLATVNHPGWLVCDGQAILRSSALGVLLAGLGYPFGIGDGSTTCNIPDFRDYFPVGAGLQKTLGETGGADTVLLTTADIPSHYHQVSAGYASAAGTADTVVRGGTQEGTIPLTCGLTGSGKSHENLPPYLAVTFIIYAGV